MRNPFKPKGVLSRAIPQSYQRGIARRYAANCDGWMAHAERTKSVVLHFAEGLASPHITLLGSGWLFDCPVRELLNAGFSLTLVDIAHPPQVVQQWKGVTGIEFQELDVTGGLLELLYSTRRMEASAALDGIQGLSPTPKALDIGGAVVSLNLLSQLPYPLQEAELQFSNTDYKLAASLLQQAHLRLLECFAQRLLITDVLEYHYTPNTQQPSEPKRLIPTVYTSIPWATQPECWVWEFDHTGAYLADCWVNLAVKGGVL